MSAARRPSPQKKNTPADVGASRGQVARGNQPTKRTVPANDNAGKAGLSEIVTREFHAQPVVQMTFRGRRCWLLSSIEQAMEYADGALGALTRGDWSSEFELGKHLDVVQGDDLKTLRANFAAMPDIVANPISAKTRAVTVVYTPGLDLLLIKTEKPIGRELRAYLVDNVMQPLRETGRVDLRKKARLTEVAVTPREAFEARAAYANKFVAAIMSKVTANSVHDEQSVRSAIQQGAVMAAGVAGRLWGEWTEEELVRVVAQLRFVDSMVDALAKRVAHREIAEKSPTPVFTINIAQLALFDSPRTAAMGGAK